MKKPKVKREVDGFKVMAPIEPGKRFYWLADFIKKNKLEYGAEIGAAKGRTTSYILKHCPNLKLISVDLWGIVPDKFGGGRQYRDWDFKMLKEKFDRATLQFKVQRRLTVIRDISWVTASKVKDESLDFIFIDADHEYESVIKDIEAWIPKLKPDGFITGHDTHFPDVKKAIDERIPNWKGSGIDHCWYAKKEDVILK